MRTLESLLLDALQAGGGVIPFAQFMDLALHAPDLGYYDQPQRAPGRQGDFFTSVSVGPLFGQLLATRLAAWAEELGGAVAFAEAGAHDGQLACDLLQALRERHPQVYAAVTYWLVEPSAVHQTWQRARLADHPGKVAWARDLGELPAGFRGAIISNEFLDAFPVHRLAWNTAKRTWFEWGVGHAGGAFTWRRMETPTVPPPDLPDELLAVLPDGFVAEACPAAVAWWKTAASRLAAGRLVTLDYGLEELEFFQPARARGTLRAYCRHQASADLLAQPGGQDLTAHINFTALRQAGERAGLTTEMQGAQAEFLMPAAARLTDTGGWDWSPERRRQLQMLTHPEYLGRRFSVLVQKR